MLGDYYSQSIYKQTIYSQEHLKRKSANSKYRAKKKKQKKAKQLPPLEIIKHYAESRQLSPEEKELIDSMSCIIYKPRKKYVGFSFNREPFTMGIPRVYFCCP